MAERIHLGPDLRGMDVLHHPELNKGTAFTERERRELGLDGLLPPRIFTQDEQVGRVFFSLSQKPDDLEKYIYLTSLQDRNERLFYRVVMDHVPELMPLIYTPTVGKACQLFGHIYRRPQGLYISYNERHRIREILRNWPKKDIRAIVVTDGERILGLGDLGADGMGIPVGKLSLYTACAGIPPSMTLPVTLDTGTENQQLIDDPLYLGLKQPRVRGAGYDAFVREFLEAATEVFPDVLIQLEDFATRNAFGLLEKYRDRFCLFDDDIQGTAAVATAGLLSALRLTGGALSEQRVLFLGAGEAGVGIGHMIAAALEQEGMDPGSARRCCRFVDSTGLVCSSRSDLAVHKQPFAHDLPFLASFEEVLEDFHPTVIIGVSGQAQTFHEGVIRRMTSWNDQPVIFALSNPTSKSECTAEQAYEWSEGRAIFASGSPFAAVDTPQGRRVPGQGNNVYIFPGVGLAIIFGRITRVTDAMFLEAARVLASVVTEDDLAEGRIFPTLQNIRPVSLKIAVSVLRLAIREGLSPLGETDDLEQRIEAFMYDPAYPEYFV